MLFHLHLGGDPFPVTAQLPSRMKYFGCGGWEVVRVQRRKRREVVVFARRVAGDTLLVDC